MTDDRNALTYYTRSLSGLDIHYRIKAFLTDSAKI